MRLSHAICFVTTAILMAACSESTTVEPRYVPEVGGEALTLQQAQSCDDLFAAIQRDQNTHIQTVADQMLSAPYDPAIGIVPWAVDDGVAVDFDTVSSPAASTGGATREGAKAEAAPSDYTETNNQVKGVQEADFVKTDGEHIYVVQSGQLHIVDSWPVAEAALEGSVDIEGSPLEMLISGQRAAVFSSVTDDGSLGGSTDCDGWDIPVAPGGGGRIAVAEDSFTDPSGRCGTLFTKITIVDTAARKVEREFYFEGGYTSSRRHETIVRAVIQNAFGQRVRLPDVYSYIYSDKGGATDRSTYHQAIRKWRADAMAVIGNTELADWLPLRAEGGEGDPQPVEVACGGFYLPPQGLSPVGLTSVVGIDLDGGDLRETHVLAQAEQIYANEDSLLLTHSNWAWAFGAGRDRTALHQFAIAGDKLGTQYLGSGFVPGHIHDQFSLDVHEGSVRVSTTEDVRTARDPREPVFWDDLTTVNRITTLALKGGQLVETGSTGALAEGESIYSTRFVGDKGYLVTFRQVDPLFVVDLSDPAKPTVLGELKIPGFSDYMHPLDKDHLLTIGRDTQAIDGGGVTLGPLALQIFDVSKPTKPALTHKFVMSDNGYSEANHNHKAFTYYASRGLLAFPFVSYERGFGSTLELFEVDVESGFKSSGSISHTQLLVDGCGMPRGADYFDCYYYSPEVRRGIFVEDYIYSVSHGGILAHDLKNLQQSARVPLPMPEPQGWGGVTGGGGEPGLPSIER